MATPYTAYNPAFLETWPDPSGPGKHRRAHVGCPKRNVEQLTVTDAFYHVNFGTYVCFSDLYCRMNLTEHHTKQIKDFFPRNNSGSCNIVLLSDLLRSNVVLAAASSFRLSFWLPPACPSFSSPSIPPFFNPVYQHHFSYWTLDRLPL